MFCPQCGEKVVEGVRFCWKCGTSVEELSKSLAAEQAVSVRKKKEVVVVVLAAAAVAVLVGLGVGAYFMLRPTPEKVLQRVSQTYQAAQALRTKSEINMPIMMFNFTIKQTSTYQRPNLMHQTVEMSMPGMGGFGRISGMGGMEKFVYVCDGKMVWVEVPGWKQVMKMPAPTTLTEVVKQAEQRGNSPFGGGGGFGGGFGGAPQPLTEVSFFADTNFRSKIKTAELQPKEDVDGRRCYVLKLELNDGTKQKLWVGVQDGLLWKNEMTINMPMGFMGSMSINMTQKYTEVTLNPTLTPDEFVYKKPKNVKLVAMFEPPLPAGLTPEQQKEFKAAMERARKQAEEIRKQMEQQTGQMGQMGQQMGQMGQMGQQMGQMGQQMGPKGQTGQPQPPPSSR